MIRLLLAGPTPQLVGDQRQQLVRGGKITLVDPDQNAGYTGDTSFIGSPDQAVGSFHYHNPAHSRTQTSFRSTQTGTDWQPLTTSVDWRSFALLVLGAIARQSMHCCYGSRAGGPYRFSFALLLSLLHSCFLTQGLNTKVDAGPANACQRVPTSRVRIVMSQMVQVSFQHAVCDGMTRHWPRRADQAPGQGR